MATFKPVKITKRGNTFQLTFYTPAGERRRISAGRNEGYARRLAVKFDDWLLEGKNPEREMEKVKAVESAKSITVRDFYPIFMKRHGMMRSDSMQEAYHYNFKNISRCERIVDAPLTDVTKSLVMDFMHARMDQDGVRPATVNREKAFLSCMMTCAVEWGFLESNPLQGLKSFKESGKRDIDISPEQVAALMMEVPPCIANIIEFACYTGFRLENILSLRIEEIRFHDMVSTAEVYCEVKGGRRLLFPLGKLAVSVIKRAIKHRDEGYIFFNPRTGTRYSSIRTSFNRAVNKLGLKALDGSKLRFHDLRHTFSNWLHMNGEGATLDQLRPLLGHKDRATTDRYVTVNITSALKVLSLLPEISYRGKQKNSGLNIAGALTQTDTKSA